MRKGQVRDLIFAGITPPLSGGGFRSKKKSEELFRSIPRGKQYIGVPLVDYNPKFKFSLVVTIRFDEVEKIVNMFTGSPPQYHSMTRTAIFRLERFMSGKDTHFEVTTENDIHAAVSQLVPVIQNRIIPFLDEHQDLKAVAEAMQLTKIPEMVPGFGPGMYAATVARLTRNPDFNAIVAGHRQRLSQFPESFQKSFQNLVEYLERLDLDDHQV